MNVENIVLDGRSQSEKTIYIYIVLFIRKYRTEKSIETESRFVIA